MKQTFSELTLCARLVPGSVHTVSKTVSATREFVAYWKRKEPESLVLTEKAWEHRRIEPRLGISGRLLR